MGRMETAFDLPAGETSGSVSEITPPVGAGASSQSADTGRNSPQGEVGAVAHGMTDEEREAAIRRAGAAMQAWYSHYQHSGNAAHLDCAYRCLGMMRTLVAGRSPAQVARMEDERGLHLPACANENTK